MASNSFNNIKKKLLKIILTSLVLITTFNAFGQDESLSFAVDEKAKEQSAKEGQNYFIRETDDGRQFFQKLEWESVGEVLSYQVSVEGRNRKGEWVQIDSQETQDTFIEVSLAAGTYRYKIVVINLLGRLEYESEWYEFEIIKAIQPKVYGVSPSIIYLEDENDGKYVVNVNNIQENAVVQLVSERSGRATLPIKYELSEDGKKIIFALDLSRINATEYRVRVMNPGGLYELSDKTIIRYKKLFDFDLSAGYMPGIVIRDETMQKYFGTSFLGLGLGAKFEAMLIKQPWGYFGLSLNAAYYGVERKESGYTLSGNILVSNIDLVYQKVLIKKRLVLDAHLGAGVLTVFGTKFKFSNNIKSPNLASLNMCMNAGLSMQVYLWSRLYVEAGCDYVMPFMADMAMDLVQPELSVGWQF